MKSIAKRLRLLIGTVPRLEEEASIIIDSRRCLMEHRLKVLRFDAQRKARPSERVAKHEHRYHVRRLHQSFCHQQKLLVSSSSSFEFSSSSSFSSCFFFDISSARRYASNASCSKRFLSSSSCFALSSYPYSAS